MAKIMPFSDAAGNTYSASYWSLIFAAFDKTSRTARVLFYGYRDKAARLAGLNPVGQKEYVITGSDFDLLLGTENTLTSYIAETSQGAQGVQGPQSRKGPQGPQAPMTILQAVYTVTGRRDIPDSTDPRNLSKMKSFFDGALDEIDDT